METNKLLVVLVLVLLATMVVGSWTIAKEVRTNTAYQASSFNAGPVVDQYSVSVQRPPALDTYTITIGDGGVR